MYDIKNLTLDEKISLLCGKDNWRTENANGKIDEIFMQDGPSGVRKVFGENQKEPATAMPTLSVVANTWSKECSRLDGKTIADECVEKDVDIILAPGVNIKKTPLNGRNFEYFAEDPFLAGNLAKEFIDGVQEKGVGTSLKHYCLNNKEFDRFCLSSEVDERALREIYLTPFEIAVKSKPWTVMCSYNLINGVHASENKWILDDILRKEFGFDGLIVSDWSAVHSPYKAVKATLDLEMPHNGGSFENIKKAYEDGLVSEEEIDKCVQNILNLLEKKSKGKKEVTFTKEQRHQNAVKIAEEGIVLLKNDGVLPLKKGKFLVCGNESLKPAIGGGGSSAVATDYVQKPLNELLNESEDITADYCKSTLALNNYTMINRVYSKAYEYDGVILCVRNEIATEDRDLQSIKLPAFTEEIINNVAKYNKNVIVVLYCGSAVDVSAWADNVKGIVYAGYAGEGVNEALSSILLGKVCPSGKLAETFPLRIEDTFDGLKHGNGFVDWYSDGVFVGYRRYDSYNMEVAFPFGHGLSYANFNYSNLKIDKQSETDYVISYDITNDSDFDAKEVSQLYVKDVFAYVIRPEKELKGFSKDLIKAHQTKTVSVKLDYRSFAYYSIPKKGWHVENGTFEILVGASSRDIKLKGKIEINLPEQTQFSKL